MSNQYKKNRRERELSIWSDFVAGLAGKNKSEVKEILGSVLSEKEKQNIVYRLVAIDLLKQGKTYREIGRDVWLSPQTISAIKKSFLSKIGDYKSYRSSSRQKRSWSVRATPKKKRRLTVPKFSVLDAWDVHEYRAKFKK